MSQITHTFLAEVNEFEKMEDTFIGDRISLTNIWLVRIQSEIF